MVVQSLQGPWLNLEEVTHKTGMVKNEILYAIQTEKITPVFYTDNRPFLAYSRHQSTIIGHGCFHYSGPVALDSALTQSIVRGYSALLAKQPVHLLCETNIFDWSTELPYEGTLPNGVIDRWEPYSLNALSNKAWEVMLLPYEYTAYDWACSMLAELKPKYYDEDEFFKRYADHYITLSPTDNFAYGIEYHHAYTQQHFRFPKAVLKQLCNSGSGQQAAVIDVDNIQNQKRTNDLHKVIARLLSQHSNAQVGTLWNTLRRDIQQANREYDNDHIITQMSHAEIHWVSSAGTQRILKKNSFKTRISQLRKVGI